MTRTAFLLLALLGLSACDPVTQFAGANLATLVHSGKSVPDFIVSAHKEKNCSIVHASRNEAYCQDDPPSPAEALAALAETRYCYRTLGSIDCYDRPDFLASGLTRVEFAAGGYLPAGRAPAPLALREPPGLAMDDSPAPSDASEAPAAPKQPETEPEAVSGVQPAPTPLASPAPRGAPSLAPSLAQVPRAEVPPLAPLPGQGTY